MKGIKVLGASGSVGKGQYTTCLQITNHTLIDAGNIMQSLGDKATEIDKIFLTHAHLDHIFDIAYLMDNSFTARKKPLKVYALAKSIDAIKKHIFNWEIWPDFSKLNLPGTTTPSCKFIQIEYDNVYDIEEGIKLIPFKSNHTVECCGYVIRSKNGAILFSADTYKNDKIWEIVNREKDIRSIIIDVSFSNGYSQIAKESKHLTPKQLEEEIQKLKRDNVEIYINHLKPPFRSVIINELRSLSFRNTILNNDDILKFEGGVSHSLSDESIKLEKLNRIGLSLSLEKDIDKLLELILVDAKNLTEADGGTLYLLKDDKLFFKVVQTDSLHIKMGGTHGKIKWDPLPLHIDGKPNRKMVAATCALDGSVINIEDVYNVKDFNFEGTQAFDKSTGYRSKSMLVVPLKNHEDKVIGVLQLINKVDNFIGEIKAFDKGDEEITLSLASQAAIAITNNTLIRDLERLLEAFLKSIIYAIGKKSKHTAGHINRMVKLTSMISKAINKDNNYFKDKHFSQNDLKVINWAALMHDIGKLSTPEYIMEKSKKLEGLYDGVEFVRFRIELIKKELEIAFLHGNISKEEMIKEKNNLDKWFLKISESNQGSELLSDKNIKLINDLSKKIYTLNGRVYKVLSKDEAEKLSVKKGTLTDKERQIINDHAKVTVGILEKLPFPEKYKRIPEIAGAHHEKLNGKGYPKGLKGDEISFEARILAIADIFEALTASDRPYKKANPLSVAMKILYFMAKDGDLDKGMVKFFYKSGLYMEYAKKLLPESSIDEVTVNFDDL